MAVEYRFTQNRTDASCSVTCSPVDNWLPLAWRDHLRSPNQPSFGPRSATGTGNLTGCVLTALLFLLPTLACAVPSFTSSSNVGPNPLSAINDPYVEIITGDFDTDGDVDVIAYVAPLVGHQRWIRRPSIVC